MVCDVINNDKEILSGTPVLVFNAVDNTSTKLIPKLLKVLQEPLNRN